MMRTVSLVEHIELEFKGNVIPQTMLLADVDNDSDNELIVGNIDGDVAIFKGNFVGQPWKKISLSGMLTCLSVGEILLPKKNNLVCMTAEGLCTVYDISSLSTSQNTVSCNESVLTQELPANARIMCLADIDMDGHVEMVIGYSDRVVRAFRWYESQDSPGGQFVLIQKWQLAGQIGSITINYNSQGHPVLMVSQPGATFVTLKVKPLFRHVRSDGQLNTRTSSSFRYGLPLLERSGSFAGGSRHNSSSNSKLNSSAQSIDLSGSRDSPGLTNQSDTISTHSEVSYRSSENINLKGADASGRSTRGRLQKSVSDADQTSSRKGSTQMECSSEEDLRISGFKQLGSAEKLDQGLRRLSGGKESMEPGHSGLGVRKPRSRHVNELDISFDNEDEGIIYHPLTSHETRDDNSSSFIVGGIRRTARSSTADNRDVMEPSVTEATCYAIATLDGSLVLVENDESILWSWQVDHELFAVSKLDVTGDGKEEVICCSWDGQTYIINYTKEIVCYHFPDSVAAFCAGSYSIHERCNVPCFVYATTTGRVFIYHNVTLPRLKLTNLLETMSSKPSTVELLNKLDVKMDDHKSLRQLYGWCLYGNHGNS